MAQLAQRSFLRSTGFFRLCAALLALGGTSCASSSGTNTLGDSGGAEQGGSGTGGASAQAGSSGSTAGGSTASSGGTAGDARTTGSAGAPAACAAGMRAGDQCPAAGLCASADQCCTCVYFPAGCGHLWDCAMPKNNSMDCPGTAPATGSACSTVRVVCQYCGANGPEFRRCDYTSDRSAPLQWTESVGSQCFN